MLWGAMTNIRRALLVLREKFPEFEGLAACRGKDAPRSHSLELVGTRRWRSILLTSSLPNCPIKPRTAKILGTLDPAFDLRHGRCSKKKSPVGSPSSPWTWGRLIGRLAPRSTQLHWVA